MERCPACRATLTDDPLTCRRCGCELASVKATEDQADALLRATLATLLDENARESAASYAAQAVNLRRTPLAVALAGFTNWSLAADANNRFRLLLAKKRVGVRYLPRKTALPK